MKKRFPWVLLVVTALCMALFALYFIRSGVSRDDTAPTVSFDPEVLSLSVHDGEDALLTGVSAHDDRDGDVTALMVVENVSSIREDHTATVTYAAFDGAGNVTKAERTVFYTDYEGPKFSLTTPLVFRSGLYLDLFQYVTAADPVDGDLTDKIKATLTEGDSDISEVGIHQVQLRVTNSMGDTARLTVPVEVYPSTEYNGTVILSDYLVYIEKGSDFVPRDYLKSLHNGYTEYPIDQLAAGEVSVYIQNNVRSDTPGTYDVTYTVSYGNYTGYTRLIVIVEE